jgi:hypothetical protein
VSVARQLRGPAARGLRGEAALVVVYATNMMARQPSTATDDRVDDRGSLTTIDLEPP